MDEPAAPLRHPDGSPVRVVIVEDDPLLAELLTMTMRAEHWEPLLAATIT